MLNIPDKIKELFDRDGVRKNFRARFPGGELPDITNRDVVRESVRFTESLCSRDVLKFGLTEASVIEFETVGVGNMYGMMIEAFCEVDTSSLTSEEINSIQGGTWDGELVERAASDIGWPFFRIPYGLFRVESCPRNHEAMAHRQVTAYSLSYSRLNRTLPGFPANMPFYSMNIDPAAFYAQATGEGLTETAPYYWASATIIEESLYDANGNIYTFVAAAEDGSALSVGTWRFNSGGSNNADFARIDMTIPQEYALIAETILQKLEELGLDLTYDVKKSKIYKSNRDALLDKMPIFFSPVIETRAYKPPNNYAYYEPIIFQNLVPGKLMPIIRDYVSPDASVSDPNTRCAFAPGSDKLFDSLSSTFQYIKSSVDYIRMSATGTTVQNPTVIITLPPRPEIPEPTVRSFVLSNPSAHKLWFTNTGTAPVPLTMDTQTGATSSKLENLPRYSYVDAYDREALIDGFLELNAKFGKVDRRGKLQGVRLATDNPVSVNPEQYSQFWWDEYDVEPIGTVIYSFEDAENGESELEYSFGEGRSIYDMTDNALLKALDSTDAATVQELLDAYFIPHLFPVAFTPIELTMQGLPYLEDGDFLAVVANDGTVARSFNMRHELSGIQMLNAEVTSVSGQIIDNESEVFG